MTAGTDGVGATATGNGGVGFPLFSITNTGGVGTGKWTSLVTTLKARYYDTAAWYYETNATTLGTSVQAYGGAISKVNNYDKFIPMGQVC